MICENCKIEHSGEYGSGRFCSAKCARSFSTKNKRKEINETLKKRNSGVLFHNKGNCWTEKTISDHKIKCTNKLLERDFDSLGFDTKRKRIIIEQDEKCNKCGISEWLGKKISFEIDHKNGDNSDDSRDNLEALCPNCHSITDTWRGRNIKNKKIVSDDEFIEALSNSPNIKQALLKLGLSPKGKIMKEQESY